MNILMFCVKDDVTGEFGSPNIFGINEAQAIRTFQYIVSQSKMIAKDLKLFKVGSFDSATGVIKALKVPEFICNADQEAYSE